MNFFTQKKQGKNKPLDVFIVDVKNDKDEFETFENLRMFIEKVCFIISLFTNFYKGRKTIQLLDDIYESSEETY